jgi:uncharacterized protein
MLQPFRTYSSYIRDTFGEKVQKISVETGYSCPNRDGSKGTGGCTYCNLDSIRPAYLKECPTIREQIQKGMDFFLPRKTARKFLAYFQTYSNSYSNFETLREDYEEALRCNGVVGLVIGTRPDCISDELVAYLRSLASKTYVSVELGVESTSDETLDRINRCHTFEDTVVAVRKLTDAGLKTGGHLILGFPWESKELMLEHARRLAQLPFRFLKLHHLQILKHTMLAKQHRENPFQFMSTEEYKELVIRFIELSSPAVVFQRFLAEAPLHLLVAPHWNGIRNFQFTDQVAKAMVERGTYQGRLSKLGQRVCS